MNKVKEKMEKGQRTIGSFFEIGSGTGVECMALSGLDYLIVDMEHGPFDALASQEFFRTAVQYGITPFARVASITRPDIMKPLDAGAQGLVIPCVKTVEDVQKIVQFAKYAPVGERGVAANAANGFWADGFGEGGIDGWFKRTNDDILLFPQCETKECLKSLDEITDIPGISGIFVGPYDLSTSMGIAGQFDHPDFIKAMERIRKVCKNKGLKTMIYSRNVEVAKENIALGFDSITYTMDSMVLIDAYKSIIGSILS